MGVPMVSDYCSTLVQHIEERQASPLSPRVRSAFLSIPRHAFLSGYYEKQVWRDCFALSITSAGQDMSFS